jgi:hypothetical protein
VNLAIAALLLFYSAQVVLDITWGNLFGNLGIDFASFWSAGHIANTSGYAAVYDLELMAQVQRQLLPTRAAEITGLGIIPTPYLPLFLLPFQALAMLPPAPAAAAWMLLNLMGSVLYLHRFAARLTGRPPERRLLLLFAISAPFFLNLFAGQVNLWLMVCVGEFILASVSGDAFRSGAWLAGLLLKPQILMLVLPAVLLQRWWRTALGMAAAGIAILGISWLLAGTDALVRLSRLWLGYAGGLPTNDPQLMMNWRMLGVHMEGLVGPDLASVLVAAGMVVTSLAALTLWARPFGVDRMRSRVASLGLFAAALTVAWHSHVHMAMLLIPLLLVFAVLHKDRPDGLIHWWILFPAALYVLRVMLASAVRMGGLPGDAYSLLDFLAGIGLFSMNLLVLGWALRQLKSWRSSTPEPVSR